MKMFYREGKNIDYGWRLNGKPILFYKDRSLPADESTHQIEKALRQMSMEYYALDRCLQCGICSSFCPNNLLNTDEPFSPRTFIQKTRLGLLDMGTDELWLCTNCGHCQTVCPFDIPFLDVMASLRHLVIKQGAGHVPASIKSSLASIANCGNPWREDAASRTKWLQRAGINQDDSGNKETIYIFLGCLAGYDHRVRKTAEAALKLLHTAQIPFRILADEEVCCGDTARRVGDFATAEKVKNINKANFLKYQIRKLYVLSPHCLGTFQDMDAEENEHKMEVTPLLELIHALIGQGIIKLNKYQGKRITFHDPCFFSKHLNIIVQPREILDKMQGVERVEMEHNGSKSLCCGGGGGGVWRDAKKGERLAEIRLDEALRTGADMLVTSCPYCLSMLEDARQGDEKYRKMEIMDICELIAKGINDENN